MNLEAKEKEDVRWSVSRTAMNKEDAEAFFEGAVHLKKCSQENNSNENQKENQTSRWRMDPSSGNIPRSSQKMLQSPFLRRLELLPSELNTPAKATDDTSVIGSQFTHTNAVVQSANKVPTGRQLSRSPVVAKNHDQKVLLVNKDDSLHCENNMRQQMLSGIPDYEHTKADEESGHECRGTLSTCGSSGTSCCQHHHISSSSLPLLHVRSKIPMDKMEPLSATVNQENTDEGTESLNLTSLTKSYNYSTRMAKSSKKMRLSQVPIHRTSEIRVSGVLRRLPGCHLQSQDLEFLMQMEYKRKAKALKKELLCLRHEVMKVRWEKEGMLAVQDNIKKDIQQMKGSYDEVMNLGRYFLSRHHQVECIETLGEDDVLSQLNAQAVLCVLHKQNAKLERMIQEMKTRKNHDDTIQTQPVEENISQKLEAYNNQVKVAECTLQRAQDDVDGLKCRIKNLQQKVSIAEFFLLKVGTTIGKHKQGELNENSIRNMLLEILKRNSSCLKTHG
ncbi:uncharacterized protein [Pleurodeles waltl]|uniref:uncharacterized protein isoform X2 n=1 Tax=Pleurodeles waltl TaxID=8319 RepID=UPI0037098860